MHCMHNSLCTFIYKTACMLPLVCIHQLFKTNKIMKNNIIFKNATIAERIQCISYKI